MTGDRLPPVSICMNRFGRPMARLCMPALPILALLLLLGGCATRPINPPITQANPSTGYRFEVRQGEVKNKDNARGCIFVRRAGIPAADRGNRTEGQPGPLAR
jgi:hypothetical protein